MVQIEQVTWWQPIWSLPRIMLWKSSMIHPSFHSSEIHLSETDLKEFPHANSAWGSCSDNGKGATEILGREVVISNQEWGTPATMQEVSSESCEGSAHTCITNFQMKFAEPYTVTVVDFAGPTLNRSGMDKTSNAREQFTSVTGTDSQRQR